jgi:hypothetical protein
MLAAQGPVPLSPARAQETSSRASKAEVSPLLTAEEIAIYRSAPTLIGWTEKQIHECPLLHGLRPAGTQNNLPDLLNRVGETSMQIFDRFPSVLCDERVTSDGSKSHSRVQREFNYIVIRQSGPGLPAFDEYRSDLKGNPVGASGLWDFPMITSNFVSSFLIMSPADQRDNHYRYFGTQMIRGHQCQVVGFAQDPATVHRISHFTAQSELQRVSAATLVQGLAWIDPQSYETLRIVTWLLAPRLDINLNSEISTIDFYPVRPAGTDQDLWMPRDVKVELLYEGVKTHNLHQYSNFRLFRSESTIKAAP